MAKVTVSVPQGTRDFGPEVVRKRNYIFNTIRAVFEVYGFQPLETPAMENIETLMGKYGEEGDKLIFKILNNGLNDPKNTDKAKAGFENALQGKNDKALTERALRYDLTIPFARYVAMNQGQLTFPFKRYQIQPVWRADRPQKGRYREFYQCDADVVGSQSLLNEVELATIYAQVFTQLGVPVSIKINSRKILAALAEYVRFFGYKPGVTYMPSYKPLSQTAEMIAISNSIDKFDKIGLEKVLDDLKSKEFTDQQISLIKNYLSIRGTNEEKLSALRGLFQNRSGPTEIEKGIEELKHLIENFDNDYKKCTVDIDFTLARGLDYYTGIIFEVKATTAQMGSIGGGGRYDDLTGLFGVPNIPGVGISFGVDRIYDVMEELQLFPAAVHTGTQVLFFNLGEAESKQAFQLFHENSKFDKQFKYAEKKNIPYIIILGSKELADGTCVIKDIRTGQQQTILQENVLSFTFN
jgi:histidyl-tRNA synthetase